jgi:hypothetical protein
MRPDVTDVEANPLSEDNPDQGRCFKEDGVT